jgi:2-keto-4-pentenoate hydratase
MKNLLAAVFAIAIAATFACAVEPAAEPADLTERLLRSRTSAVPMRPFAQTGDALNLSTAYSLQNAVHEKLLQRGESLAGYKVAFTTKKSLNHWKVTEPCLGTLYWSDIVPSGDTIDSANFVNFHIEAEIAFTLKAAITSIPKRTEDLDSFVGSVHLCFDIPDLRFTKDKGWPTVTDLVADSLGAHGWTLGGGIDPKLLDSDLEVELYRNGELHSRGPVTATFGGPWNVLAWLAQNRIDAKQPLQAGQVVLTGPLAKAYLPASNADAPGFYEARAKGLGAISINVK